MIAAGFFAALADLSAAIADPAQVQTPDSPRHLVHVLLAYGFAWIALLGWGWRIARLRKPKD